MGPYGPFMSRLEYPSKLEFEANADFGVITSRNSEKCHIPLLALYARPDWQPVEFEMTWTELTELKTKLDKFFHDHVVLHPIEPR